jgi:hypothetical protein
MGRWIQQQTGEELYQFDGVNLKAVILQNKTANFFLHVFE